ncbi:hypothetical protein QJS10_CPB11g00157 [Acorus calamus]|uniref:Glyoxalase At5g48480-like N-terminal domain-containing protein n=1 Tax=Acorus calamus TaxID=4465 RepID=A0AAV9DRV7_ACOCL|nr:hypothetical protein QJS10_CPB11g00157 [Acorus calamus]
MEILLITDFQSFFFFLSLSFFAASDVAAVESGVAAAARAAVVSVKTRLMVAEGKADETVKFYKAVFGAEELNRISYPKKEGGPGAPSHHLR